MIEIENSTDRKSNRFETSQRWGNDFYFHNYDVNYIANRKLCRDLDIVCWNTSLNRNARLVCSFRPENQVPRPSTRKEVKRSVTENEAAAPIFTFMTH